MEIMDRIVRRKWTIWPVVTAGGNYEVSVDPGGVWHCTCLGAQYRGECYHIHALKYYRQWRHVLPQLTNSMMRATPMPLEVFEVYLKMHRFILHPNYLGERKFLLFSRRMFCNMDRRKDLEVREFIKLSGTILEVVQRKPLIITDLLYLNGQDYRPLPLRDRLVKLGEVMGKWRAPEELVMESAIEMDPVLKVGIARWSNNDVILKDLNSPYFNHPCGWVILR